MLGATARIGFEAQLVAAEFRAQVFEEFRRIITVGLIQLEESEPAEEDVVRSGKALTGQDRGQYTAAGSLAGLQALGQRAIYNALAVAGGLAECDPQRIHHLLDVQSKQLAGSRRGAEHTHCRGAMPTSIDRRGQGDTAGNVEPERNRQQQPFARHAAKHVGYRKACGKDRCAWMDRTAMVERIVEIERMRHAGVQHGGLWCRQPLLPQHHLALRRASPAADDACEFRDAGCSAAAEQTAERVKDVVACGHPGGGKQVRETTTAYVLGQRPSWILDHVPSLALSIGGIIRYWTSVANYDAAMETVT